MPFRLKRWQWGLVATALAVYVVFATFGVYGGFYIGFPPLTPMWLNNTQSTIERTFDLRRPTRLHLYGDVGQGQVVVKVDGQQKTVLVGLVDEGFVLPPGRRVLRLENRSSTGLLSFKLE